ncbi:MAG: hypothetical protein CSA64_02085 [Arachnia propionica]|nr:MAG: hypothetical protein CSA64_02085 [Arachnia propionica]
MLDCLTHRHRSARRKTKRPTRNPPAATAPHPADQPTAPTSPAPAEQPAEQAAPPAEQGEPQPAGLGTNFGKPGLGLSALWGRQGATLPPKTVLPPSSSPLLPSLELITTPEWHLARRATQAPTAQTVADIELLGIQGWLDQQLDPELADEETEDYLNEHFPWASISTAEVDEETDGRAYMAAGHTMNALLHRPRLSKRQLRDSIVEVLGDHLYVSMFGKAEAYAGEYDQLLRAHALGRYVDLLQEVLTHPALLVELDNQLNSADNPNENLGRELLELYSVGIGHYDETDMRQSTLILTGHGVAEDGWHYQFHPDEHYVGKVQVMDFTHPNDSADLGSELLVQYLDYLAHHPGTATRLATKFAVRYISDEPAEQTIAELAQVYLDNDTSIPALVRATLTHPEFTRSVGHKWKRPFEFISTIARAADLPAEQPRGHVGSGDPWEYGTYGWLLTDIKNLPRDWPVVDGYPDTAAAWNTAAVLMFLWNAAQQAVYGDEEIFGEISWPELLQLNPAENATTAARRIAWQLTGFEWSLEHLKPVAVMLSSGGSEQYSPDSLVDGDELDYYTAQAVRLVFASPYGFLR